MAEELSFTTPDPASEDIPFNGTFFGYSVLALAAMLLFTCALAVCCSPKCQCVRDQLSDWMRGRAQYRFRRRLERATERRLLLAEANTGTIQASVANVIDEDPALAYEYRRKRERIKRLEKQKPKDKPPALLGRDQDDERIERPLRRFSAS